MIPPRIHLIGIGGIGLSAIARVLLARGVQVSGSDQRASEITDELARLGAKIFIGHVAENIGEAELVLVTSAAPEKNVEVIEARRREIRVAKRCDYFPELTTGKKVIAVAGTHGKTTTTGMIATMLVDAGLDPDAVIGGIIPELNGNGRGGRGEYFVIEADEYDRAFLGLRPNIAVVTNIEMDHPDIYKSIDEVTQAFQAFMQLVPSEGVIVACGESPNIIEELNKLRETSVVRYGFDLANDWRASNVTPNARGGSNFVVWRGAECLGDFELQIPGVHNVLNALAALVVADQVKIDLSQARATLENFRGAARRFQVKGDFGGVTIIDDYAHHPTEIRATLAAARARYPGRAIWAVFQPHTYSRTAALLDEFAGAFADADHVIVTEIYAARETHDLGMSGALIVDRMTQRDAQFIGALKASTEFLREHLKPGDILITLGAGDVNWIGAQIARARGA